MEKDKEKESSSSTIGAFFGGVASTLIALVIFGIMVGIIIAVARKVAGPAQTLQIVESKKKDDGTK
jgi:hypothetical protein